MAATLGPRPATLVYVTPGLGTTGVLRLALRLTGSCVSCLAWVSRTGSWTGLEDSERPGLLTPLPLWGSGSGAASPRMDSESAEEDRAPM